MVFVNQVFETNKYKQVIDSNEMVVIVHKELQVKEKLLFEFLLANGQLRKLINDLQCELLNGSEIKEKKIISVSQQ